MNERNPSLIEITADGRLRYHFHRGQWRAWQSNARFVTVLAGTQGGKTSFGPLWLYREIQHQGPGDYLVVTPTYPLLELKALPEFKRHFEERLALGAYVGNPVRKFTFSEAGCRRTWGTVPDVTTQIFFGYAADPDSLESATAKAAWLDEAGQKKFKLASWEAILRRLSIHQGRTLITTTPYGLGGWLKKKLWDRRNVDPEIDVIRFSSLFNPLFPRDEYERAKRDLPRWKFDLFYRAIFTRPAGLIYDCFVDEAPHVTPRFAIPGDWPRYLGMDFGGVHTAGVFYAKEPGTNKLYAYREYLAGQRVAQEHAKALLRGEPMVPLCVGGARSEGQWRREFRAAGLPVRRPPVSDVEVGINRVYGAHKRGEMVVFNDLDGYLDEKLSYSRKLDENDEPTEQIRDKNTYHFMDAERYIISLVKRPKKRQRQPDQGEAPAAGEQRYRRTSVRGRL